MGSRCALKGLFTLYEHKIHTHDSCTVTLVFVYSFYIIPAESNFGSNEKWTKK